ncbi:TonB-dependent receptor [Ornithobacterium rhinotracheale]|uniref:SusC/RagA family TonB-linked outer membrane protein n=1 Tax=Ornithobacterium rhinotracheale TaxID=28251 RepID=UPI00129CA7F0|nr:TonB-dependent receptor [Ornithobacterium rhinotracheale]MRJ09528.1 TonB-dependent receptor [Ornithobacterium rhinotracheale]
MKQKILWSGSMLLLCMGHILAQITGKVQDEYGPLQGALVTIVGTNTSVETNAEGAFSIPGKVGDVLDITNPINFSQKTFPVKSLKMGVLKLNEKEVKLEVVVAYGKQKKENLTGSVSVVDSKAFEDRPVSNAVQALQGQVAGMNFNMGASGTELGSSMKFDIRGTGTIGGSSSNPLVLIDGVEGDLSSINPQDIESVSVLKDAASSSIYGSRAAFGVILVTTKSGKTGKVRISYNNNLSWTAPTIIPETLDSESFAYYVNDAMINDGKKPRFDKKWIEQIIDYKNGVLKDNISWNAKTNSWYFTRAFANTNWSKVYYRDWSPSQEHNLTINGGTDAFRYYVSSNFLSKEGLLRFNTDTYDRYTLNGKFSADLTKWLKLDYNSRFIRVKNGKPTYANGGSQQFYQTILKKWPTYPAVDLNGHYLFSSDIPLLEMGRFTSEQDILYQTLNFTVEPVKNWITHFNFTYKTDQTNRKKYINPVYEYDIDNNPFAVSPDYYDRDFGADKIKTAGYSAVWNAGRKINFFTPNIFTEYSKDFGAHNLKGLVGFQSELYQIEDFSVSRNGSVVPGKEYIDLTQGDQVYATGGASEWTTAGFFGRLNYAYENKYMLEFNLRYDGASRFLDDLRWALYPSVSIGWNIANEKFWENMGGIFNKIGTFKLRGSYGSLGNQTTRDFYPYYSKMVIRTGTGKWLINGTPTNQAFQPALISEGLTWEKVVTYNAGLDISAFKNKFDLSFDIFARYTNDMVGPAPTLPGVFGAKEPQINNTDLVTRGFELALGWNDRIGKDFKYSVRGTLTDSRQKVTNYPNALKSFGQAYYPGQYLGEIWGYVTHGIAKTEKEMQEWLKTHDQTMIGNKWGAGDIMYEDLDGDGKIYIGSNTVDNPGDRKIIGNATPRFNFGLDLSAAYKGVDLKIFLQGVGKRDLALEGPLFQGFNMTNMWNTTAVVNHIDYFRPADTESPLGPNVDSYFPRVQFIDGIKNFYKQTRFLQNGAYLRVKNIQLGYTLPKNMTKSIGLNSVRFYFSGENLFTFTKLIDIFDPEAISAHSSFNVGGYAASGSMYPMSKVISTGININF